MVPLLPIHYLHTLHEFYIKESSKHEHFTEKESTEIGQKKSHKIYIINSIIQLLTFLEVNIRIYHSKIYDIYQTKRQR